MLSIYYILMKITGRFERTGGSGFLSQNFDLKINIVLSFFSIDLVPFFLYPLSRFLFLLPATIFFFFFSVLFSVFFVVFISFFLFLLFFWFFFWVLFSVILIIFFISYSSNICAQCVFFILYLES